MRYLFFITLIFSCQLLSAQDTIQPKALNKDTTLKIFDRVDIEASYPGGAEAWKNYILSSSIITKASGKAVRKKIPAGKYTVIVVFIIGKKGEVSDIKATTNHGYGLGEAAVEVIKASGKWNPAWMGGETVKAFRQQPITFVFN